MGLLSTCFILLIKINNGISVKRSIGTSHIPYFYYPYSYTIGTAILLLHCLYPVHAQAVYVKYAVLSSSSS